MNNNFEFLNKHFGSELELQIDDLNMLACYILNTTNDTKIKSKLKEIIVEITECYMNENVKIVQQKLNILFHKLANIVNEIVTIK